MSEPLDWLEIIEVTILAFWAVLSLPSAVYTTITHAKITLEVRLGSAQLPAMFLTCGAGAVPSLHEPMLLPRSSSVVLVFWYRKQTAPGGHPARHFSPRRNGCNRPIVVRRIRPIQGSTIEFERKTHSNQGISGRESPASEVRSTMRHLPMQRLRRTETQRTMRSSLSTTNRKILQANRHRCFRSLQRVRGEAGQLAGPISALQRRNVQR